MPEPPITTATQLKALVESLVRELRDHEQAAAVIRATLGDLRKHLASTPGARAGTHARSGKRTRRILAEANPEPIREVQ